MLPVKAQVVDEDLNVLQGILDCRAFWNSAAEKKWLMGVMNCSMKVHWASWVLNSLLQ